MRTPVRTPREAPRTPTHIESREAARRALGRMFRAMNRWERREYLARVRASLPQYRNVA